MEAMTRPASQEPTDVISAAASGDEVAFARIVAAYHEDMRRVCAFVTRDESLAERYPRYGCPTLHDMLVIEGEVVNKKRTYRIYCEEGLQVRTKRRKKLQRPRLPMLVPAQPNERWSVDFMSDQLANGRRFRILKRMAELPAETPDGWLLAVKGNWSSGVYPNSFEQEKLFDPRIRTLLGKIEVVANDGDYPLLGVGLLAGHDLPGRLRGAAPGRRRCRVDDRRGSFGRRAALLGRERRLRRRRLRRRPAGACAALWFAALHRGAEPCAGGDPQRAGHRDE